MSAPCCDACILNSAPYSPWEVVVSIILAILLVAGALFLLVQPFAK